VRSGVVRRLNCRDKFVCVCVLWFLAGEGAAVIQEAGGCDEAVVTRERV
jgi:hypothetical protein